MPLFQFFMGGRDDPIHIYIIIAFLFLHEKKIFYISFSSRDRRISQSVCVKTVLFSVPDNVPDDLAMDIRIPDYALLSDLLTAGFKLRLYQAHKAPVVMQKQTGHR